MNLKKSPKPQSEIIKTLPRFKNKSFDQQPQSEIIKTLPRFKNKSFDQLKIKTLRAFEANWRKKTVKEILAEYIHMIIIAKDYRDYKKKSLTTSSPKQYEHAFKSFLEFGIDRGRILREILKTKGIKFTPNGRIDYSALNPDLKKYIQKQIKNNKIEPGFIMNQPLDHVVKRNFKQTQYQYELLPYIMKLPAFQMIIKKLEAKLGKKVFIFPGTIQNMKFGNKKFFVFDIDFCTRIKSTKHDSHRHEEYRDFHYPFWISTAIHKGKVEILVRSHKADKDVVLLRETFNLSKFSNYTTLFDYISKKIVAQNIVDKMP